MKKISTVLVGIIFVIAGVIIVPANPVIHSKINTI